MKDSICPLLWISVDHNCLFPDFYFKVGIFGLQEDKALHNSFQWGCAQTTLNRDSIAWSQSPAISTGSRGNLMGMRGWRLGSRLKYIHPNLHHVCWHCISLGHNLTTILAFNQVWQTVPSESWKNYCGASSITAIRGKHNQSKAQMVSALPHGAWLQCCSWGCVFHLDDNTLSPHHDSPSEKQEHPQRDQVLGSAWPTQAMTPFSSVAMLTSALTMQGMTNWNAY